MPWAQSWALLRGLSLEMSTHFYASVRGWEYPYSREAHALADLFDLTVAANTDEKKRHRIKRYQRPYETRDVTRSKKPTLTQEQVRAELAARAPQRTA